MKIIYSIAFSLLCTFSMAQQSTSFEDSEGFVEGDINGQGFWISTPTGDVPPNVTHQMISLDNASDGSHSLRIVKEPIFGTQTEPIIGGFYNLPTPLAFGNFSVSFDINMSQHNGSVFGFQAMDSLEEQYVVRVDFDKTGVVTILNSVSGAPSLVSTPGVWSPDIWYRFKVISTSGEVKYYLNDVLIFTGVAVQPLNIGQLRFVHNNAIGTAYVDNIKVNNDLNMRVKDFKTNQKLVQLYPNPASDVIKIKSPYKIKYAEVFDLTGKRVEVKLSGDHIDLKNLIVGEYILKVETEKNSITEKFIKN
ncbi:T9SS C-terminal target domain-containing protein [Chryseobacterium phosphatilyticum]|uniref:T9SS C-terminal target domain-containing protein n=1 Tax=Chryseobacterium phosphatilyticum TaxID=475075 RepID=A0A316XG42_9FLAO|nr:T9SS type A sorting domain-containing protein [Chryseobacterium phosphatilyticum]PWN71706.1 T9SS C-terminal target domain-containing protein [Chryseobacterium phosphatilyticum]